MDWQQRLYDDVLMYLPDAPKPIVDRTIMAVAGDFFRDTQVLRDEMYIDGDCVSTEFLLPVPDGRRVVFVDRVSVGKCGLTDRDWRDICPAQSRHAYGYWLDLNTPRPAIRVPHAPREDEQIAVEYRWTVQNSECEIPQYAIDRYLSVLRDGVLAQLYSMRLDETMFDPAMAGQFRVMYERERDNAMNEKWQNFQQMPIFMQGGRFL